MGWILFRTMRATTGLPGTSLGRNKTCQNWTIYCIHVYSIPSASAFPPFSWLYSTLYHSIPVFWFSCMDSCKRYTRHQKTVQSLHDPSPFIMYSGPSFRLRAQGGNWLPDLLLCWRRRNRWHCSKLGLEGRSFQVIRSFERSHVAIQPKVPESH